MRSPGRFCAKGPRGPRGGSCGACDRYGRIFAARRGTRVGAVHPRQHRPHRGRIGLGDLLEAHGHPACGERAGQFRRSVPSRRPMRERTAGRGATRAPWRRAPHPSQANPFAASIRKAPSGPGHSPGRPPWSVVEPIAQNHRPAPECQADDLVDGPGPPRKMSSSARSLMASGPGQTRRRAKPRPRRCQARAGCHLAAGVFQKPCEEEADLRRLPAPSPPRGDEDARVRGRCHSC